jgi:hypothetical protein
MKEIMLAIENSQGHESFEIHYKNGFVIEGWVTRVNHNTNPATVILASNEDLPDHMVNYSDILKVVVKPLSGKEPYTLET